MSIYTSNPAWTFGIKKME